MLRRHGLRLTDRGWFVTVIASLALVVLADGLVGGLAQAIR